MASSYRRPDIGYDADRMTTLHWVGMALAAITGAIHVYLYVAEGNAGFLFAGVVFSLGIVGVLLNVYPRVLYVLGVPFTAGQIVIWLAVGTPFLALGVVDKVVQVLLIGTIIQLFRWEGKQRVEQPSKAEVTSAVE